MTKPLVRFAQTVWELSGWKELEKFLAKVVKQEEEMTVLIHKLVQQRDEALALAEEAIRQRNEAIERLTTYFLPKENKKVH